MTPPRPCMLTGRPEGVPRCEELSTTSAAAAAAAEDREIQQLNNYSQLGRKEPSGVAEREREREGGRSQLPWETKYLPKPLLRLGQGREGGREEM